MGSSSRGGAMGPDRPPSTAPDAGRRCPRDAGDPPRCGGSPVERGSESIPLTVSREPDSSVEAGPASAAACSALQVVLQMVALGLELVDALLDDVADAHDAGQLAVDHDRKVADAVLGELAGDRLDLVVRPTGEDV